MAQHEVRALRERAKELRCLYRVHEVVSRRGEAPAQTFLAVLEVIPDGWQVPEATGARIEYLGRNFVGPGYASAGASLREPIQLGGTDVGSVEVSVTAALDADGAAFLAEERELLRNIAHRLGEYLEWKHTELLGERATTSGVHWRWREGYAEAMAAALDATRFGVREMYLHGSTETGDAGPGSDIDLIIVDDGPGARREQLRGWCEGWSLCLAELALQQTGYGFPGGILNIRWMTETPDLRQHAALRRLVLGGRRAT